MQIITAPNHALRQKAKPLKRVTTEVLKTVKEMVKITESFVDPEGVGLAAPQVGISNRFFIAKFGTRFEAFFNPQILSFGKKSKVSLEGCLSIPDYYGEVARPTHITVSYQNEAGQAIKRHLSGTKAMVFQHENDHLEGKLFIDYVLSQKGRLFKVVGKDAAGADIFEEVRL